MEISHPLDEALRDRLRSSEIHQTEFAKAIGRNTSWLNKYMNGAGHATVDDVIRMVAILMGVNVPTLSEDEQKLLKACRALNEGDRQDVLAYAEHRKRLAQRGPSKESSETATHKPPVKARKVREKR